MGLPRSAYYKPRVDLSAKDAEVVELLNEIEEFRPRWELWKRFHCLKADGKTWNPKKVKRLYCAMKLNLKHKANKRIITRERQLKW